MANRLTSIVKIMLAMNFFILMFFYTSDDVFAKSLSLNKVEIEATIDEYGDMHVVEYDTYTFVGHYNGIFLDLSLTGSDGIEDFKAYELIDGQENKLHFEVEMDSSSLHRYKVYASSEDVTKTLKFTYTYKNVVRVYEDTAELHWAFFDEVNTMSIDEVDATIILPSQVTSEKLFYFGHGNLDAIVYVDEQGYINFYSTPVTAGQLFEVRVLFPPDLVRKSNNIEHIVKLDEILEEERLAIEYDILTQSETQPLSKFELLLESIFGDLFLLFPIFNIGFAIFLYVKYKRPNSRKSEIKYLRELPSVLPPAIVSSIINDDITSRDLIATLMDLVRKDQVILTKLDEENYQFRLDQTIKIDLQPHEQYIIEWLLNNDELNYQITINQIKSLARDKEQVSEFI